MENNPNPYIISAHSGYLWDLIYWMKPFDRGKLGLLNPLFEIIKYFNKICWLSVEETLITSMESCKVLIKLSLNLHKFYTVLPCQCFFLGILLCSQSGDRREEDAEKQAIIPRKILAKSCYKPACSVQNCTNFQRFDFQPLWKFCCPPLGLLASWWVSQITEGPEQNRPFSCNFQPPFYLTDFSSTILSFDKLMPQQAEYSVL